MPELIDRDNAKKTVARNVRRLLDEQGWTQADLARAIGESEMRVSLMVRGITQPTMQIVVNTASALGVTLDDLLS